MIGKTISHYRIIEKLGEGGMGIIYRAVDTRLERDVAVKFLPQHLSSDPVAVKRFVHEAKAASAIDHSHIGTIYEIDKTEDGVTFIVMAHYDGETLRERMDRGGLSLEESLCIASQIASGLSKAHKKDIIHRDIKPSNIIITSDGDVKIIDFGLAKLVGRTKLTKESSTLGTVAYMSPEQARGEDVDHRSDIFSLGVILYEMLAGEPPFKGEHEAALLYCIVHEDIKPISEIRSHLPGTLTDIVDTCLAKDPSDRYEHTSELAEALKSLTIRSAGNTNIKQGRKGMIRKRPAIFIIAACLIAISVFIVTRMTKDSAETEQPVNAEGNELDQRWEHSIAVLPFRDLSSGKDQSHVCLGITDAVNCILSEIQELKVISTTSVMKFKETEVDIKDIGTDLGVGNILEGTVQKEGDRIRVRAQLIETKTGFHLWADTYDEQYESVFEVQDKISDAIAQALKLELAPAPKRSAETIRSDIEAYEYYTRGLYLVKSKYVITFDEDEFQAGIELLNRSIERDPEYIMAYFALVWAYEHHFQVTGNRSDADSVKYFSEIAFSLDTKSATINAMKGYVLYVHENDHDKAFEYLKKALEINPNIGDVNFLAGTCFLYHGLYEQSLRFLLRSSALNPYYFWTPYKIAMCYMNMEDFENAAHYFEEYFELAPVALIFPDRYIALMVQINELERVEELIDEMEISHPDYGGLPYCKALLFAARGEKEDALALFRNSAIFAMLDMKDEALDALQSEIRGTKKNPYIFYRDLLTNPFYNSLREDSRFKAIIAREQKLYDEAVAKYRHFNDL